MGHAAEILIFVSVFTINLILMRIINQVQHAPYMDELFHTRQVKHYCQGNFSVVREGFLATH